MSDCNCNELIAADQEDKDKNCPAKGFQKADVCVQVTVTPFAKAETPKTTCCGDPVVTSGDKPCAGRKNGECKFTIKQTICVEVPVVFGAKATVGDTFVDCLGASGEDICTDCDANGIE